jgi:hypothetical protein
VFHRLTKAAVAVGLACSIGLHWGFFQSVAWVGMVVNYSQNATFTEALVKTFDGKHPCALCQGIARGKQSERKSQFPPELKKFEFLTADAQFIFSAPTHCWVLKHPSERLNSVSFRPPSPPPRAA